mmetsp:Transcript_73126/g.214277  ORF Transcript_73126/g.214277 Transcript_73126/m.214277 type:complete len:237 (+) Transcript_73126:906-1616(+)
MPGPGDGVRQVLGDETWNAQRAVDGDVREVDAKADLQTAEKAHSPGPLPDRPHGGCHHEALQGVRVRRLKVHTGSAGLNPSKHADARDKQPNGGHGPDDDVSRGRVAHEALLRPVVGVCHVQPWALSGAGPRCPKDKSCKLPGLGLTGKCDVLQGVESPELRQVSGIATREEFHVEVCELGDRLCALLRDPSLVCVRVVGVSADLLDVAVGVLPHVLKRRLGLTVQPICAPVGRLH